MQTFRSISCVPQGGRGARLEGGGSAEPHPARLHCQVLCINHTLCPHIPAPISPSKKRLRIKPARNEGAANSRVNMTNFCQGRKQIKVKGLNAKAWIFSFFLFLNWNKWNDSFSTWNKESTGRKRKKEIERKKQQETKRKATFINSRRTTVIYLHCLLKKKLYFYKELAFKK